MQFDSTNVYTLKGTFQYSNGKETSMSRRAFQQGDKLYFYLKVPRCIGVSSCQVLITSDTTKQRVKVPLRWNHLEGWDEIYSGFVDKNVLSPDLYFLKANIKCIEGTFDTIKEEGDICHFSKETDDFGKYQLTISKFKYKKPSFMEGGTIYQIFVDRFCSSHQNPVKEGAILNPDWDNGIPEYPEKIGDYLENNVFFGGDLQGIESKLDYFVSLGVTCLYLTPIFDAYSNHKYDTGNYMEVDSMFGGDEALQSLISHAKEKGIGILLDGVFNHTGDHSIYFNKYGNYPSVGAYQSKESPFYDWYHFYEHPNKYECWWNIPILPRINCNVPSAKNYFLGKDGVIEKYAKMGICGMRLDVADELSDEYLEGVKKTLTSVRSDAILYGEVWEDASNKISYEKRRHYFQGKQLDGVMNYELRVGIYDFLRNRDPSQLRYALLEVMANAPLRIANLQMNLIGSHDTIRAMTALGGDDPRGFSNHELANKKIPDDKLPSAIFLLKCAYLIASTVPGIPMIYYGDEIGMQGYQDPFNRMPFRWNDMNLDILSFYQKIGTIRKENPSIFKSAPFKLLKLDSNTLVFSRLSKTKAFVTIIHLSDSNWKLSKEYQVFDLINHGKYPFSVVEGHSFKLLSLKISEYLTFEKENF